MTKEYHGFFYSWDNPEIDERDDVMLVDRDYVEFKNTKPFEAAGETFHIYGAGILSNLLVYVDQSGFMKYRNVEGEILHKIPYEVRKDALKHPIDIDQFLQLASL